jgi:tripeptide aminopeptidase
MKQAILDRFLRYVQYDTQSAYGQEQIPSTDKQWALARQLQTELLALGLAEVSLDEHCYLMATLPANTDKNIPTIGFIAHIDTAPDFTAAQVRPKVWENYQGQALVLDPEQQIILSPDEFPELLGYQGQTLITTDGQSLLGADDKAGVTEIISAMAYLLEHPEIEHGKIRICFTPDEEVGRGADLFNVEKFGAAWAYTMDSSAVGDLEFENFNAAGAKINIQGKNIHPGYAKDRMVNSIHLAQAFIQRLPAAEVPEKTSGYEGFFHLNSLQGEVDKTVLHYIIRDHDRQRFEARKILLQELVAEFNEQYPGRFQLDLKDQYYNMREKVEPQMEIVELAAQAMRNLGIEPSIKPIRGGTDGARLSFMGLPCPNIFAGGMNFHGRYEYVALESMVLATQTIVEIAKLVAQKA